MLYFINKMIQEKPITNFAIGGKIRGYQVRIRQANYRGGYLSCIDGLEVTVDGERVPEEAMTFCVNDKRFSIGELPDMYKEYWYVLDEAVIEVDRPGGLPAGEHEVEVTIFNRSETSGYFNECEGEIRPTKEKKTLVVTA